VFLILNRVPFVTDPELVRPSIPVMTHSLDQKCEGKKVHGRDWHSVFWRSKRHGYSAGMFTHSGANICNLECLQFFWLRPSCSLLWSGSTWLLQWLQLGYNGWTVTRGGWPSARLFGWSAADWSRSATNKSISSERKRESLLFCWERKSWTSWLLTCCSKKGWAAEESSKKGVNRKEKCFLSSQTRWYWQI